MPASPASSASSASRAAAANAWMLEVKDLTRSPGSMRTVEGQWPAPEELSVPLLGIPAGSPVDVELRLESVHEGILVTGTADAELEGECSRCLDPIRDGLTVDLQELFLTASSSDDEDESLVVNETVDLEPVLRDAVVTALPFQPVCRPDCEGLCPVCGIRMEDAPAGHAHEQLDPRWAALAALAIAAEPGTSEGTDTDHTDESGETGPQHRQTSPDETEER